MRGFQRRPAEDIPYTFSNEIVPPTSAASYEKTTFEMFVARLRAHDPYGWVWTYTIDADRVIRRSPEALPIIDEAYLAVTRELLDEYELYDVRVIPIYDMGQMQYTGVYWNDDDSELNIGSRQRTIALNAHMFRYVPVRAMHDTILHEIAHALTEGHEHDDVWRSVAVAIGSSARIQAGIIDRRYIAENRYDSAVVFRCREGCFESFGKMNRGRSVIRDIVEDCDEETGELKNAHCIEHHNPIRLFPPRDQTVRDYIRALLEQNDEIEALMNSE